MHLLEMTFWGVFEQFNFVWHLLEQCRAIKILVSSSFFEQMNFEQLTLLLEAIWSMLVIRWFKSIQILLDFVASNIETLLEKQFIWISYNQFEFILLLSSTNNVYQYFVANNNLYTSLVIDNRYLIATPSKMEQK